MARVGFVIIAVTLGACSTVLGVPGEDETRRIALRSLDVSDANTEGVFELRPAFQPELFTYDITAPASTRFRVRVEAEDPEVRFKDLEPYFVSEEGGGVALFEVPSIAVTETIEFSMAIEGVKVAEYTIVVEAP